MNALDRMVRQVKPEPKSGLGIVSFSQALSNKNVILLGDPGAGKSYLFEKAAGTLNAEYVTVRNFLNKPANTGIKTIFIDALDEKRSGRTDQDTIDALTVKLFDANPEQVRLSCRVQDWLGETDFAALKAFFNEKNECFVFILLPLTKEEQISIVGMKGVDDAEKFINEAQSRGLQELLENPQTLSMLVEVVKEDVWPATRKQLFDSAVETLLQEHNTSRQRTGIGAFTTDELRNAAGAACAIRIISDTAGLSLAENSIWPDIPSYRRISLEDTQKVLAALSRRAFKASSEEETVDYTHRTVAEFLAAQWLSNIVRAGLPINRLLALTGVDGVPVSSLRGLHAWLPVFLTEYSSTLIKADPYGVLTYGDSASLTASERRLLLDELAAYSEIDPWFLSRSHIPASIGGLATPDMVTAFSEILLDSQKNHSIKSLILSSLSHGGPRPEIRDTLLSVLKDDHQSYHLRTLAADALLKQNHLHDDIKEIYISLSISGSDIRLREKLLSCLYGTQFDITHLAQLVRDALRCPDKLPTGPLYFVDKNIPVCELGELLDALSENSTIHDDGDDGDDESPAFYSSWEVCHFVERILKRILVDDEVQKSGPRLWKWFSMRQSLGKRGGSRSEEIQNILAQHPSLVIEAITYGLEIADFENSKMPWQIFSHIHETFFRATNEFVLMAAYSAALIKAPEHSKAQKEIFEQAILTSQSPTLYSSGAFDSLYEYGNSNPHLIETLLRHTYCIIPDWRIKGAEKKRVHETARREERARRLQDFHKEQNKILAGEHYGWMEFLANRFLFPRGDDDKNLTPRERLAHLIGHENVQIALDGLVAFAKSDKAPTVENIIDTYSRSKYCRWWYAVVAGLDELTDRGAKLNDLPAPALKAAIAINLYLPSFPYSDNNSSSGQHKWLLSCLADRPDIVATVYIAVIEASLLGIKGKEEEPPAIIHGLHELLTLDELAKWRSDFAITTLGKYKNLTASITEKLIRSVLFENDCRPSLQRLFDANVKDSVAYSPEYGVWVAAAYLFDPGRFANQFKSVAESHSDLLWIIRNFDGYEWGDRKRKSKVLSIEQIKNIIFLFAPSHPNAYSPREGWSGDANPWDAADYIKALIDQLSNYTSLDATRALEALQRQRELDSYSNEIRHALTNQRVRYRDAIYRQPELDSVIETLSNRSPANPADLHALLISHIKDLAVQISSSNARIYAQFWNEEHKKLISPKPEDSARDVLVNYLRNRLAPLGISVEPEGCMASEKRADIVAIRPGLKAVLELKRDHHAKVWTALSNQLDRLYTRDPDASGYGIYVVFWFGDKRGTQMPKPEGKNRPTSAKEMQEMLNSSIAEVDKKRLTAIVIDVSGAA